MVTIPNAVDLLLDQTLTLTISGKATDFVMPDQQLFQNTASVTYTSINDAVGETADERNGSGGAPDPNILNNYFDSATSPVITVPGFLGVEKSIVDPPDAEVSIGQTLTYRVAVSLIEVLTLGVTLVDELPDGTVFVPFVPGIIRVPTIPGVVLEGQSVNYDIESNELTISWTSVTIPGLIDSGAGAGVDRGSFVVEYKVLVLDVPENTSARPGPPPSLATVLENIVMASATEVPETPTDMVEAKVVEPFLTISKVVGRCGSHRLGWTNSHLCSDGSAHPCPQRLHRL